MIKIDMHTHTSGVSFCSTVTPKTMALINKLNDVDAIVLTNHYSRAYMFKYANTFDRQIQIFLNDYKITKAEGEKLGLDVLLGAEVAIETSVSPYTEFLLYGATEEFFLNNPSLYDKSQSELYTICNKNNVLLFQSHPFRRSQGHSPADPEFMDGIELNKHYMHDNHNTEAKKFADKHKLKLISGSDLHYKEQAGTAGIFAPKEIRTARQLAAFLKNTDRPKLYEKKLTK